MKKITIQVIPHSEQRYSTCGDWYFDADGNLEIRVSDLGDWRHNALVAVHELYEVILCKHDGVTQEAVDQFDMEFEKNRKPGNVDEPGDNWEAPYRKQHCQATGIERLLAASLDVDWNLYADAIEAMP